MFRQSKPPAGMRASAIVLGSFDGVHLGHQALLAKAKALADRDGLAAVAITFRQHPLSVLCPDRAPALLSTGDERARLMQAMGMDGVVELEFTPALAGTQPEEFIRCHRSFIINRKKIEKVVLSQSTVVMEEGLMVPISRSYRTRMRQA